MLFVLTTSSTGRSPERIPRPACVEEARFYRVEARFYRVEARFDRVEARLDRVEARFDRVEARFDRVEARLVWECFGRLRGSDSQRRVARRGHLWTEARLMDPT